MRRIVVIAILLSLVVVIAGLLIFVPRVTAPQQPDQGFVATYASEKPFILHTLSLNASLIVLPIPDTASLGTVHNPVPLGQPALLTTASAQEFVAISEVNRGSDAWKRIQRYDAKNSPPSAGKEYLMALVVIRYMRGAQDQALLNFQIGSQGVASAQPAGVVHVRPEFLIDYTKDAMSGGWVVREVDPADPNPLLAVSLGSVGEENPNVAYFATSEQ